MIIDKNYCMSTFLGLRYVPKKDVAWASNVVPSIKWDIFSNCDTVKNAQDIDASIKKQLSNIDLNNTAILLSGGMDSAILATYLPKGATAYTMRSIAEGAINEIEQAKFYANKCGLNLKIVDVTWEDYLNIIPILFKNKKSPHHSIEPLIYKCLETAKKDGFTNILCGELADTVFGGLDGLLSKDWEYNEFIDRYIYLNPQIVLKEPVDFRDIFEKYRKSNSIDSYQVIREIFAIDSLNSYITPAKILNINLMTPYANMKLGINLDLERIRRGENKYLIRELFSSKYPNIEPNKKLPMPRAVGVWLKDWSGPKRSEFKNFDISTLKPDQKWLCYILEKFLNAIDNGEI